MNNVICNILDAAVEAGIEGMSCVEEPYSTIPIAENTGVIASVLLAPDFGERSPWCVRVEPSVHPPEGGVIPCAMQIARIEDDEYTAHVYAARLVGLFPTTKKTYLWRPLGPFQEVLRSIFAEDWEKWILDVEEAIADIPELMESMAGRRRAAQKAIAEGQAEEWAKLAIEHTNRNLSVEVPGLRLRLCGPGHVRLEDAHGRQLYAARCEDTPSALDTVKSWTYRTLIIHPYECEAEA